MNQTLEVMVWGTGGLGGPCIAAIGRLPRLRLVGVRTYSFDKSGQDSGLVAGHLANGIPAECDREVLLPRVCDCVLFLPRHEDFGQTDEELLALLAHGHRVVTPLPYHDLTLHPDPLFASRLTQICHDTGASLITTGVNPDVISHYLLPALSRLCLVANTVTIHETWSCHGLEASVHQRYGLGLSLEEAQTSHASIEGSRYFVSAVCAEAARAFSIFLESMRFERIFRTRPVEAGGDRVWGISHLCHGYTCAAGEQPAITVESLWQLDPAESEQWTVNVTGQPNLQMTLGLQTNTAFNGSLGDIATILPPDIIATVAACIHAVIESPPRRRPLVDT